MTLAREGGDEVMYELLLGVVARVDLSERAARVRPEEQVDPAAVHVSAPEASVARKVSATLPVGSA